MEEEKFDEKAICNLLLSIKNIIKKYPKNEEYNIFLVLDVHDKEVIMCRMLFDLLNPNGRHGQGDIFLNDFLKHLEKKDKSFKAVEYIDGVRVEKEYSIKQEDKSPDQIDNDDKKDDRRIDIVIHNAKHFLPIEVKINAPERENQCLNYYNYAKDIMNSNDAKIVYLTKNASKPMQYEKMRKNCICLSWEKDIIAWLDECLNHNVLGNTIEKELIEQYMKAISNLTRMREKEMDSKCAEIISESPDNVEACVQIIRSFSTVQNQIIKKMFKMFDDKISQEWEKYTDISNHYTKIKGNFFGDVFGKYASQKPCTCFKISNYEPDDAFHLLYIHIDSRVWSELRDSKGKRVMNKWIYLPTGKNSRNGNEDEKIPNFEIMNRATLDLYDEDRLAKFCDDSLKAIKDELLNNSHFALQKHQCF